jgi:hypothetical protein
MEWTSSSSHHSTYESSIIFFDTVFCALESIDSDIICFASDFTHQYTQYGGFGNIWGFVSADPDGASFHLFIPYLTLNFLGCILPLAIGHHSGNESKSTWSWFLRKMKDRYPQMSDHVILLDRDKGGRDAVRYFFFSFSFCDSKMPLVP